MNQHPDPAEGPVSQKGLDNDATQNHPNTPDRCYTVTGILIAGLITALINIALVALNLKLYTEWFKDRSIRSRQ